MTVSTTVTDPDTGAPVVVDFRVDAREKVFPMVPAGQSNDDLVLPPSQSPRKEFLR